MALPVASAPLPPDIAIHGWGAITVRVAWTLLQTGIRVTNEVLVDARDHVLFHLEPNLDLASAEDLAEQLTREFVQRARRQSTPDRWPQDARMPISPRWHKALTQGMPKLETALLKQHYGNALPLSFLAQQWHMEPSQLEATRSVIRDLLRRLAVDDGVPVETWPQERLDRLIARIAAFSAHPSPPLDEVADGCHQDLVRICPRCERTWRLAQQGILTSEDLVAPGVIARPEQTVELLALHFQREARHHREVFCREITTPWFMLGDDILLVDLRQKDEVMNTVLMAAELGMPSAHELRGAEISGLGRWSPHGLLGPLASEAFQSVRSVPWGTVNPIGELPAELPTPPSSRLWWVLTAVTSIVSIAFCAFVFWPSTIYTGAHPLELSNSTRVHMNIGFNSTSMRMQSSHSLHLKMDEFSV